MYWTRLNMNVLTSFASPKDQGVVLVCTFEGEKK